MPHGSRPGSTPTKTEAESLRAELAALHEKGQRGEIPRRKLEGLLAERSVALCRSAVRARLDPGEPLRAEHHAVLGHLRLAGSLMQEPDQEAVSLFATDRRLIRVRSMLSGSRPPSCDERDGTAIEELPLDAIEGLVVRRQVRWGEAAAGVAIAAFALAFKSWLLVTGTLLAALGGLGVLHALLLPTRWIEIRAPARLAPEPWRILAARKKSARALCRVLRGALASGASQVPR